MTRIGRGKYHFRVVSKQSRDTHVEAYQTTRTGRVDVAAVSGEIEKPADAVGVDAGLCSEGERGTALLCVLELDVLPVVGEAASVDRGFCPGDVFHGNAGWEVLESIVIAW